MIIKALLMDFNGVVINDEPIQHQAYREMFAADGIDVTDEMYYARLGMDDKAFIASILKEAGRPAEMDRILELSSEKTKRWQAIIDTELPMFPGVDGFIRRMANDLALGLVSMAKREEIDHVLERAGLAPCFSVVVSAENVSTHKPDPECYRTGFRMIDAWRIANGHLPMVHSECVVIEDSPAGVQSARSADLPVLGVSNTVSADELRAAGATWVAWNLDDWMPESVRLAFA